MMFKRLFICIIYSSTRLQLPAPSVLRGGADGLPYEIWLRLKTSDFIPLGEPFVTRKR